MAGTLIDEFKASIRDDPDLCEAWLDFITRTMDRFSLAGPRPDTPDFMVHGRVRTVNGFSLVRGLTTAGRCRIRRDAADIAADGHDRFGLFMSLRGCIEIGQFGRSHQVRPSALTCVSTSEPSIHAKGGRNDLVTFYMPRAYVEARVGTPETLCVRPHDPRGALYSLASETLTSFVTKAWRMNDTEFEASARAIADLVLIALSGPASHDDAPRTVRPANLARAKRIIAERLHDPDLTLADIAAEAGLSLRYLHELFHGDDSGETFFEYLKRKRLTLAREMIAGGAGQSITAVALECGFSNPSYFSTAFKQHFGYTPRDARQQHRSNTACLA